MYPIRLGENNLYWEFGVEFDEGKKDLFSKDLFPLLRLRPLLGTERKLKFLQMEQTDSFIGHRQLADSFHINHFAGQNVGDFCFFKR